MLVCYPENLGAEEPPVKYDSLTAAPEHLPGARARGDARR